MDLVIATVNSVNGYYLTHYNKYAIQGDFFIPLNEFIDMTMFQCFLNSPEPINKQTVREKKDFK